MSKNTMQDIMRRVEDEDVEFIRLQFTDIFGNLKNVAITSSQLERAMRNECMFDGSSIEGFARIEESDMYLYPDLDTFAIFPWRPQQGKVARIICDVYRADGTPFEGDSRGVLKRQIEKVEALGYQFAIGPECEFFLFHQDENGQPTTVTHEQAGYFDIGPLDLGENARRDMVLTLEDMGYEIEASHHECAAAQHEIDFKYDTPLCTADNIMTFKLAVKTVAKRHGLFASFMPKPKNNTCGSGMHINISLHKDGKNIFDDPQGEFGLSQEARYFIGGIIKHIKGLTLLTNPLINSYKRLAGEDEAPGYIAWSQMNRSPLIRIPSSNRTNKRIELRSPDPAANPYLALAACIAAGMDGIENKLEPPEAINENLFAMTEEQRKERGVECLPKNMKEAIDAFEKDDLIWNVVGDHIANRFVQQKKAEWDTFCDYVTDWELNEYLYKI